MTVFQEVLANQIKQQMRVDAMQFGFMNREGTADAIFSQAEKVDFHGILYRMQSNDLCQCQFMSMSIYVDVNDIKLNLQTVPRIIQYYPVKSVIRYYLESGKSVSGTSLSGTSLYSTSASRRSPGWAGHWRAVCTGVSSNIDKSSDIDKEVRRSFNNDMKIRITSNINRGVSEWGTLAQTPHSPP